MQNHSLRPGTKYVNHWLLKEKKKYCANLLFSQTGIVVAIPTDEPKKNILHDNTLIIEFTHSTNNSSLTC